MKKHVIEQLIESNKQLSTIINQLEKADTEQGTPLIEQINEVIRQLDRIVEHLDKK